MVPGVRARERPLTVDIHEERFTTTSQVPRPGSGAQNRNRRRTWQDQFNLMVYVLGEWTLST